MLDDSRRKADELEHAIGGTVPDEAPEHESWEPPPNSPLFD